MSTPVKAKTSSVTFSELNVFHIAGLGKAACLDLLRRVNRVTETMESSPITGEDRAVLLGKLAMADNDLRMKLSATPRPYPTLVNLDRLELQLWLRSGFTISDYERQT